MNRIQYKKPLTIDEQIEYLKNAYAGQTEPPHPDFESHSVR